MIASQNWKNTLLKFTSMTMTLISPALRPKIFHCNRKPIPPHGKGRLTAIRSPHTLSWMVELNNSRGEAQTKNNFAHMHSNWKFRMNQACILKHKRRSLWLANMFSQSPMNAFSNSHQICFFSVRPPAAREGGRQAFNYANPNGNLQTTFQQKCPTAVAHSKAIYTPPSSKVVNRQKQLCNTDHLPAKVLNWPESNTSALHTFQQKQATQGQQKACVSCSSTGNKEAKEAKEGRACHFSFYGNT